MSIITMTVSVTVTVIVGQSETVGRLSVSATECDTVAWVCDGESFHTGRKAYFTCHSLTQ